jgi:hypothetical protein
MAIYFSLGFVQPFADMATEGLEGVEGVDVVRGDGRVVGLRLEDHRTVLRIPEIAERLGLEEDRIWARLRADDDVLLGRRQATWGGGGA